MPQLLDSGGKPGYQKAVTTGTTITSGAGPQIALLPSGYVVTVDEMVFPDGYDRSEVKPPGIPSVIINEYLRVI